MTLLKKIWLYLGLPVYLPVRRKMLPATYERTNTYSFAGDKVIVWDVFPLKLVYLTKWGAKKNVEMDVKRYDTEVKHGKLEHLDLAEQLFKANVIKSYSDYIHVAKTGLVPESEIYEEDFNF